MLWKIQNCDLLKEDSVTFLKEQDLDSNFLLQQGSKMRSSVSKYEECHGCCYLLLDCASVRRDFLVVSLLSSHII